VCLYRDLPEPGKIVATLSNADDGGKAVFVEGFDENDRRIRQYRNGSWQDGWQIPTIYGTPVADSDMPTFKRVTRVWKDQTAGNVQLWGIAGDSEPILLADYEPDETEPSYRRILINRSVKWIRVAYKRRLPLIQSKYDRIPLRNRFAVLMALKAIKAYHEAELEQASLYEATASRLEIEAQNASEPVTMHPVQIAAPGVALRDNLDWEIT